jgi:hypothetical protein
MKRHILKHSYDIFIPLFRLLTEKERKKMRNRHRKFCGNVRKIEDEKIQEYIENGVSAFKKKCDLIADNERRENKYSTGTW